MNNHGDLVTFVVSLLNLFAVLMEFGMIARLSLWTQRFVSANQHVRV